MLSQRSDRAYCDAGFRTMERNCDCGLRTIEHITTTDLEPRPYSDIVAMDFEPCKAYVNTRCRPVNKLTTKYAKHTEKCFQNLIKSNRNQIVSIIFRMIWNQTDVHLIQNQSENGEYNLISV